LFILNDSNIIDPFSGFKPTPMTFDPSKSNHSQSQEPLKPVDPVTRTFKFL